MIIVPGKEEHIISSTMLELPKEFIPLADITQLDKLTLLEAVTFPFLQQSVALCDRLPSSLCLRIYSQ